MQSTLQQYDNANVGGHSPHATSPWLHSGSYISSTALRPNTSAAQVARSTRRQGSKGGKKPRATKTPPKTPPSPTNSSGAMRPASPYLHVVQAAETEASNDRKRAAGRTASLQVAPAANRVSATGQSALPRSASMLEQRAQSSSSLTSVLSKALRKPRTSADSAQDVVVRRRPASTSVETVSQVRAHAGATASISTTPAWQPLSSSSPAALPPAALGGKTSMQGPAPSAQNSAQHAEQSTSQRRDFDFRRAACVHSDALPLNSKGCKARCTSVRQATAQRTHAQAGPSALQSQLQAPDIVLAEQPGRPVQQDMEGTSNKTGLDICSDGLSRCQDASVLQKVQHSGLDSNRSAAQYRPIKPSSTGSYPGQNESSAHQYACTEDRDVALSSTKARRASNVLAAKAEARETVKQVRQAALLSSGSGQRELQSTASLSSIPCVPSKCAAAPVDTAELTRVPPAWAPVLPTTSSASSKAPFGNIVEQLQRSHSGLRQAPANISPLQRCPSARSTAASRQQAGTPDSPFNTNALQLPVRGGKRCAGAEVKPAAPTQGHDGLQPLQFDASGMPMHCTGDTSCSAVQLFLCGT